MSESIARLAQQVGRAPQTLYNRHNTVCYSLAAGVERRIAGGAG